MNTEQLKKANALSIKIENLNEDIKRLEDFIKVASDNPSFAQQLSMIFNISYKTTCSLSFEDTDMSMDLIIAPLETLSLNLKNRLHLLKKEFEEL